MKPSTSGISTAFARRNPESKDLPSDLQETLKEATDVDPMLLNSATPIGSGRFYYKVNTNQGDYYYTPSEFIEKGLLQGSTQFFDQGFLRNPDAFKTAKSVNIESGLIPNIEAAGYENPNQGILMNRDQAKYVLGSGTGLFEDWDNDIANGGFIDLYDINSTTRNGNPFGAIQGIGNIDGQYVYIRPTESNWESSYIIPSDQFDNGYSMRSTRIEYKGIFGSKVAKALAGVAREVGKVPFLTELTAAIPLVGPVVYGTLKGAQAGLAGKDPLEAAAEVGASLALASGLKSLTGGEGVFGGDVEAQPGGFYGEVPGGAIGPAPGVEVSPIDLGGPTTVTPIEPGTGPMLDVGAPVGGEVAAIPELPVGVTPIEPVSPAVSPEILAKPPSYTFDDGSTITFGPSGQPEFTPATDFVEPGFRDPSAPGFYEPQPAPVESREADLPPYERGPEMPSMDTLKDLLVEGAKAAYDVTPVTALALASGAVGTKPKETAPAEPAEVKKTYQYRAPIEAGPTKGLKELYRASDLVYGDQLPPLKMPTAPSSRASFESRELLGGPAPGGLAALRPTYTPLSGGPTIDIGRLSMDQLIQLQNALEGRQRQLG